MSSADPEPQPRADAETSGPELPRAAQMEALFREHNQGLVRFLAARLSSDAEAREVAQEAYVRLLQLDQPRGMGFLRALLYKSATNIAIDRLRRRRLERQVRSDLPFDFDIDRCSPEAHVSSAQQVAIVARCLRELGPRTRQAILLSRLHGMSSSEIATTLGVSTRMVRMYVAEALMLIGDRLDQGVRR
jgi:RNA polymerase sigma factor (sigma-70 family)